MAEQSYEAAMRRLILLSSQPVKSLIEKRERDRLLSRTVMQATESIGDNYWATSDLMAEWTAKTDAASYEEAQSRYEQMLADPELALPDSDGAQFGEDTDWLQGSKFAPKADR